MRRVAAQILTAAANAMNSTAAVDVIRSTDFAPAISPSRKRPLTVAPATPGIAPAATVSNPCRSTIARNRAGAKVAGATACPVYSM